jgi:hypothetical protein
LEDDLQPIILVGLPSVPRPRVGTAFENPAFAIFYFEFRYRFDPWWHDNKTQSELDNEYRRVNRQWRNAERVPWLWTHFPKAPQCSIIPSYWQRRLNSKKDQPKRKFYNRHCATLRQFFWKNKNSLEDPERYFEAVSKLPDEIKSMIRLSSESA